MPIQLLHITDPHLRADPAARLHGWDVEQAFARVLADAVQRYPNYHALVLGGDLVDDGSPAGYRRLDSRLAELGRPVLAMAGNHDDPAAMTRHLKHAQVNGQLQIAGWSLIALNSHRTDSDAGRIGHAAITALDRTLARTQSPTVVFVHHPPCSLDSAWLDAIGLEDAASLLQTLGAHSEVRAVVCGHAHQAAHRRIAGGIDCWTTPATMRQFRPGSPAFAPDQQRTPGYRWLSLSDDGRIHTRVHRVAAAAAACG